MGSGSASRPRIDPPYRVEDTVGARRALATAGKIGPQLALASTVVQGGVPIRVTRRIRYLEEKRRGRKYHSDPGRAGSAGRGRPAGAASGDRYPAGRMPLLNH